MVTMATNTDTVNNITLSTDEFALLYEYLDREHSMDWDVESVGLTTKIGKQIWDRVQEIAVEQNFTPTHTPIEGGKLVYVDDGAPEELVWLGDPDE
jgi:hypothetical protein